MIMLPKATRVMSDRQPIALIGHDVVGTGGRMGNLPVYHLVRENRWVGYSQKYAFNFYGKGYFLTHTD